MRDEVKGFKRDRILEAATQLFYERGFTGTTMQAVADRLQVTKPFIYSYFKDKKRAPCRDLRSFHRAVDARARRDP